MSFYNEYKTSELFQVIQESNFTEDEYDDLKNELETGYKTNNALPMSETSERACALIRFAIKHLCRVYPSYGINNYVVLGVSHDNDSETVVKEVDATHEEQAKFYFHTHYNHKQYKVVSVTKL